MKIEYGRCIFELPKGFQMLEGGCLSPHRSEDGEVDHAVNAAPVCITLVRNESFMANLPVFSENVK